MRRARWRLDFRIMLHNVADYQVGRFRGTIACCDPIPGGGAGFDDTSRETRGWAPRGEVSGIEPSPAHDLWVVRGVEREHLIPAVAEIVVDVDVDARRVVIRPPEGLLEL